jgi:hypothetical protein
LTVENDFLAVATGAGATVDPQATFAASTYQTKGLQAGEAFNNQINKIVRQSSSIAAVVSQLICDITGQAMIDDGNIAAKITELLMALEGVNFCGTSGGTANAQTLTPALAPSSYTAGALFSFIAGSTNTAATTINIAGLGPVSVYKLGPSGTLIAFSGGEFVSGLCYQVMYNGSQLQIVSPQSPAQSYGTSGYYQLPGGLIIQWGSIDVGSGGVVVNTTYGPVSFPIAFPNAVLSLAYFPLTYNVSGGPASNSNAVMIPSGNRPTTTSFYYAPEGSVDSLFYGMYWFAIGY